MSGSKRQPDPPPPQIIYVPMPAAPVAPAAPPPPPKPGPGSQPGVAPATAGGMGRVQQRGATSAGQHPGMASSAAAAAGTALTGEAGVDPRLLQLGRNTLLGA